MDIHLISYYIGISIIFLLSVFMIIYSWNKHRTHDIIYAVIHLIGASMIAFYFITEQLKEKTK